MRINLNQLNYEVNGTLIIDNLSININSGAKVGLLGPNGCGKTTLLKLICGLEKPSAGSITFDDIPLTHFSRRQLATQVGFMMQHAPELTDLSVKDVISLGRLFDYNKAALNRVIEETQLVKLALHSYNQLSGGERQRVMLTQLLYQNSRLYLLDEPANHLDIKYSWQLLSQLKQQPNTCIASYHCFNLAAAFCDELILMCDGSILTSGSVSKVLTPYWLKQAYGVDAEILHRPNGAIIVCINGVPIN